MNKTNISDLCALSLEKLGAFFEALTLTDREMMIARQIVKEIRTRLGFLLNVGLNYLTLDRSARTLAGGEAQRIRLATQIGSGLMGVLYILDEPSIGLHQRDNTKLIALSNTCASWAIRFWSWSMTKRRWKRRTG